MSARKSGMTGSPTSRISRTTSRDRARSSSSSFCTSRARSRRSASWSASTSREKHWKFSAADVRERGFWGDYMHAFEEAIRATAAPHAPWFVVPADNKWFTRLVVAAAIVEAVEKLDLSLSEDRCGEEEGARGSPRCVGPREVAGWRFCPVGHGRGAPATGVQPGATPFRSTTSRSPGGSSGHTPASTAVTALRKERRRADDQLLRLHDEEEHQARQRGAKARPKAGWLRCRTALQRRRVGEQAAAGSRPRRCRAADTCCRDAP